MKPYSELPVLRSAILSSRLGVHLGGLCDPNDGSARFVSDVYLSMREGIVRAHFKIHAAEGYCEDLIDVSPEVGAAIVAEFGGAQSE